MLLSKDIIKRVGEFADTESRLWAIVLNKTWRGSLKTVLLARFQGLLFRRMELAECKQR